MVLYSKNNGAARISRKAFLVSSQYLFLTSLFCAVETQDPGAFTASITFESDSTRPFNYSKITELHLENLSDSCVEICRLEWRDLIWRYGCREGCEKAFGAIENKLILAATDPVTDAPVPDLGGGGGGGFAVCFSGDTIVDVLGKGPTSMSKLQIGDKVKAKTSNDDSSYETVYSFGHYNPKQVGKFIQITTTFTKNDNKKNKIEMSEDHLILLSNGKFVPAGTLKIGDQLVSSNDDEHDSHRTALVSGIKAVQSKGVYAPFTMSGTIVVSGFIASSFVTLQEDQDMVTIGGSAGPLPIMSAQTASYLFESIHRLAYRLGITKITKESYSFNGVSSWVEMPRNLFMALLSDETSIWLQLMVLLPCMTVLSLVTALEYVCFSSNNGIMFFAATAATIGGTFLLPRNKKYPAEAQ